MSNNAITARNVYATEMEARLAFVAMAGRYCTIKEGSEDHKALLWWYNQATSGYNMTSKDAWCAAFLSAIAAKLGYEHFPLECSCSRMMALAEKLGVRIEKRGYRPQVGDWLIYDLDLKGSTTDHIGVVSGAEGDTIWVTEGNYSDTVKPRKIRIDDPRIYRYICPDYTELVQKEDDMKKYTTIDQMPDWAKKEMQSLQDSGAMKGRGGEEGLDFTEGEVRILTILERRIAGLTK